ncbi:MAG: replication factor C small subunit [Candidatus Saliniplasma sp.]
MEELWTEKYRPDSLEHIIGQQNTIEKLRKYKEKGNLPHLILVGPSGVGKTSSTIALTKEIYGDDWKGNFLELNASDRRGIKAVREEVKNAAMTTSLTEQNFKIIFIDEAESFSDEAQAALRRILEQYSENTRFVLSCSNSSKIIDPIRSRCVQLYFRPLNKREVKDWIDKIVDKEDIDIEENAIKFLINYGKGNLRKVTNLLQVSAAPSELIKEEDLLEYSQKTGAEEVKRLIKDSFKKDFLTVREKLYELMIEEGFSGKDLLEKLHEELFKLPMDDETRRKIVLKMAEVDYNIIEGSNDEIHLKNLLAYIRSLA